LNAARTRQRELSEKRTVLVTEQNAEKTNIVTAEAAVQAKKDAKDAIQREVDLMEVRRKNAIEEIRLLTKFKGDYGGELYNQLLEEANTYVTDLEAELRKKGILEETTPEPGKKIGVIVSKEDKERVEGMRETVEVARVLTDKVNGLRTMRKDELQREFTDPRTSQDNLLRYVFGAKALSPDKKPLYQRLLSKSGLVEAFFEYTGMDEAKAMNYFAREPEMLTAFRVSRGNILEIDRLRTTLGNTYQLRETGATGLEKDIKSLESQIRMLQDQNVQLLTPIYESKVVPFLGEHGIKTSEFMRVVIDRMVKNAQEFDPFADAVQSAETIRPHTGPDGATSIRGPDINPMDGSWINRGETQWNSPGDYQVSGENVALAVSTKISNTGELNPSVKITLPYLRSLVAVLPDNKAAIVAGSAVEQELQRVRLLDHLYDASGAKQTDAGAVIKSLEGSLPTTRPDMVNTSDPDTIRITDFLKYYGLEEQVLDNIYLGPGAGNMLNDATARQLLSDLVHEQISTVALAIEGSGISDASSLESWLVSSSNYKLGELETGRMFASLARTIADNSTSVNKLLLGETSSNRFGIVSRPGFSISNDNGELRLNYQLGGSSHSASLKEVLKIEKEADRLVTYPGLNDIVLNDLLLESCKNSFDAIRTRTK